MKNGLPSWTPLGTLDKLNETIKRFRENLALYSAACLLIRDKEAKFQHLAFNEAQKIVDSKISDQLEKTGRIRAIILKARQEGVSTYVAARNFRAIHLWPGTVAIVVADELGRAEKLFGIYERYLENLPHEIMPTRKSTRKGNYLAFRHDSEISVRPSSDAEAGRAQTIHRLHASELAFWGNTARETWVSLMNAIPRLGSEVIVESTAKGAGGLFHELWEEAENSESGDWLAIFLPWWIHGEYEVDPEPDVAKAITDSPDDFEKQALEDGIPWQGEMHVLSMRKLAWRRMVVSEVFGGDVLHPNKDSVRFFQQEYPATAEEAFLVSGSCFFDEDELRKMSRGVSEPGIRGIFLRSPDDKKVQLETNVRGSVRIYEPPVPEGHYVIGGDTAEGKLVASRRAADMAEAERGGRDYSAAVVLRLPYEIDSIHHPARVVAEVHGPLAPEVFAEQVNLIGQFYACGGPEDGTYKNNALVGVERSHSSGNTVLRLLREHHRYSPLYWHRQINHLTHKIGRRLGWVTDGTSRMPMLDYLAELVRKNMIDVPSKDIVREMMTFVVWPDGKPAAEEGTHDDRVMALGIACSMMRDHRHSRAGKMPEYKPRFDDTLIG